MGLSTFVLMLRDRVKFIETIFLVLVSLMGLCFIVEMFIGQPAFDEVLYGLIVPTFPRDSVLKIVSLVGSLLMPHNVCSLSLALPLYLVLVVPSLGMVVVAFFRT